MNDDDQLQLNVVNEKLQVDQLKVIGIGAASVLLIGDTETIQLSSAFDTPPESIIIGPLVPFNI